MQSVVLCYAASGLAGTRLFSDVRKLCSAVEMKWSFWSGFEDPVRIVKFTRSKHWVDNRALLGYYAASSGDSLPTFRDIISVPLSRVRNPSPCWFLLLLDGSLILYNVWIVTNFGRTAWKHPVLETIRGGGVISIRLCKLHHPPYAFISKYVLIIMCRSA